MSKRPGLGISPAPITLAKRRRPQHQGPKEDKVYMIHSQLDYRLAISGVPFNDEQMYEFVRECCLHS